MKRGIPSIDFNDVMDQKHFHDTGNINVRGSMVCQYPCVHGQVPRMFSRIFLPAPVKQRRLTHNVLQPINFPQKAELPSQISCVQRLAFVVSNV